MKIRRALLTITRYVFLGFILVISIVPFLWCFMSAFKSKKEILSSAFALPNKFSFENFSGAFEMAPLGQYFMNSTIITFFCIVLGCLFISMGAYVFARFEFKGKDKLYSLIALALLIPSTAIILPVFLFMNKAGLYDTKGGLVLVYLAISMPTVIYVMRSFFLTIPKEVEEAAYIDGANFYRTYFSIIIPLSKPGLATCAILIYLCSWNDFLYALMLTSGNKARTIPVALAQLQSAMGGNYGQIFAACTIIVLPSIIIYFCLQKKIETALMAGAIKG